MNGCGRLPQTQREFASGMSIELPLYGQEKNNTCALACLRMVLAAFGTEVAEAAIEAHAQMKERGTVIDELERLARQFHLVAEIQDATVEELRVTRGMIAANSRARRGASPDGPPDASSGSARWWR